MFKTGFPDIDFAAETVKNRTRFALMQSSAFIQRFASLTLAAAGAMTLASCTTTNPSSLTALSNQNKMAVARIAEEEPATEPLSLATPPATAAPATTAPLSPVSSDQIAGLPAPPASTDPVAVPKPAPTTPATTLASVPRTPVSNRPTNQIMMVRTTAYTHTESDHLRYGRKSAAGNTLQYGSVRSAAADWSKYPLGTRFMIEGLPYEYVVDDYGSALVGTETIDIYKPEKGTMNNWGVRNVPIRVLEWGSFEESRKILDGRKHVRHADHVREMLQEIEKKGRNGSISLSPTGTSA